MSTSRVSEVQLRLRIPAELAASTQQLRAVIERELIARVLDELERLLHERFGAQVVIRIRHLALRWRIDERELGSAELVPRLARELADQIIGDVATLPASARLRPRDPGLAMFASARHADAAYLADVADGTADHWVHTRASPASAWAAIVASGPEAVVETVHWLREMARVDAAIAGAPDAAWTAIELAVPSLAPAIALVRARATVGARVPHAPGAADVPGAPPSTHAPASGSPLRARDGVEPAASSALGEPRVTGTDVTRDRAADTAAPDGHTRTAAGATADTHVAPSASTEPTDATDDTTLAPSTVVDTAAAGVFFLAGRVLEIDLAERLWAAGLPEGDVLAHVAATLLGHTDDPAWRWFGGVFDRAPSVPLVEDWASAEVIEVVQHALGRRLVHFGVATSPAVLGDQLDRLAALLRPSPALAGNLARLVSRSAAALVVMVAARLGREPSIDDVRAMCTRDGRLVLGTETLHVVMPPRSFDLAHRRSGLDHAPGCVPWLGRDLRFELAGGDVL